MAVTTPSSGKEIKPAADRRIHRVGFAINNKIVSQLAEFPVGINESLMTLRLHLNNNNRLATTISVCRRDCRRWNNIIGKEGVGKANSNGILLLSKCAEHDRVITITLFRQRNMYKTTWMHPRSKHWNLLDYVIVHSRDRKDIRITRAMRGTVA